MKEFSISWVFGYGGLILPEGRNMTLGVETNAIPVILTGYERFWGFIAPQCRLTTVSLRLNDTGTCAGVLFPVTLEQLKRLDLREEGYDRIELLTECIHVLQPERSILDGKIYTYMAKVDGRPSLENPITQSDVDAIVTGCLKEHGEPFAREIIRTTSGWENPWVDDREVPRYPWSLHEVHFAQIIDQILQDIVPVAFNQRLKDTFH